AVLPGIPHEVKTLTEKELLPRLKSLTEESEQVFSRYIQVAGIGESTLSDEVLGPLDDFLSEDISLAFLPSLSVDTIQDKTKAATEQEAERKNKSLIQLIYEKADEYIIGEGKDLTLSEAVGRALHNQSFTISTAESCTGGLLASTLTDVPGSSDYMIGGI